MDPEEAALRAKIQAMKNLLQVKKQQNGAGATASHSSSYHHRAAPLSSTYRTPSLYPHSNHSSYHRVHNTARPVVSANRSWNRLTGSDSGVASASSSGRMATRYSTMSANKVWRKEDAGTVSSSSNTSSSSSHPVTAAEQRQPESAQKGLFPTGSAPANKSWKRSVSIATQ